MGLVVIKHWDQTSNYLEELDLKLDDLKDVGERILNAYFQTTANDARIASGMYAYLGAVRALGDVLGPRGWKRMSCNNLEMICHPDEKFYVLPSSGDKYTGDENFDPRTRNPKGSLTIFHVKKNIDQLKLFSNFWGNKEKRQLDKPVWIYLYYIDHEKEELRSELSFPIGMDQQGYINKWEKRRILPPIYFGDIPYTKISKLTSVAVEDIEIKVRDES